MDVSIIEYFSENQGQKCGYCNQRHCSYSHGLWAHNLTCKDYQDLIDRGWRRSGCYCYKPTMDRTCCPQYTIKCDATAFNLTKSQKKVLKKFRNFVVSGGDVPNTPCPASAVSDEDDSDDGGEADEAESNNMDADSVIQNQADQVEQKLQMSESTVQVEPSSIDKESPTSSNSTASSSNKTVSSKSADKGQIKQPSDSKVKKGQGPDPNKPLPKKKKDLRRERALAKGKDFSKKQQQQQGKTLEELTSLDFPADAKHKFEIRIVAAQTSNPKFMETFDESYQVYKKYQMVVHNDSGCPESQFTRFLCNSSLIMSESQRPGAARSGSAGDWRTHDNQGRYIHGGYHMQYVMDGRIFAVGVIDILNHCVSSVYLYYDSDFSFLSPGTLTSLFELALVRKIQAEMWPEIRFYYMGYYIHSCPKMRYKAKYSPSWLLCPVTYDWVPVEIALPLLDKAKFAKLSPGSDPGAAAPPPEQQEININNVLVLYRKQPMPFSHYMRRTEPTASEKGEVEEYANLVGQTLANRILLYRSP